MSNKKNHTRSLSVSWDEMFWPRLLLIAWTSTIGASEFCNDLGRIYSEKKNDKTFYLIKSKMPFFEASNYCMKLGLQFAIINDQKQLQRAENLLQSKGITKESVWIGGTNYGKGDTSKEYYWYPTSAAFSFTNWDTYQPDGKKRESLNPSGDPEIERCVYLRSFVDAKYKWADGLCSEPLFVLCENSCDRITECISNYICTNPDGGPTKSGAITRIPGCREAKWVFDHILDASSCSCLATVNKTFQPKDSLWFPNYLFNWWEARNWCLRFNSRMAVIYNEDDQNAIKKRERQFKYKDHLWVGGTDWGQHDYWYWESTGHVLTKFDGASEPHRRFWKLENGTEVVEHCLYLDVKNGYKWRDADCFSKKNFACEGRCGNIHQCYCDDHSSL